ncbi:hypothetical protein VH569_30550 [Azospirillum sp. 11R-A]|uniref:hypothetical protein n=1 Tax=Azospirillum sp. 11R-A TaxID=3111634 RepID=UPI003C1D96FD
MEKLRFLLSLTQKIDKPYVREGVEYLYDHVKVVIRVCMVSSGALSIACISGWYSSTEVPIRVSSYILFTWFALSSLLFFAVTVIIEKELKPTFGTIIFRGIIAFALSLWTVSTLIQITIGAASVMKMATIQPFKKEMKASDYDDALRKSASDVGLPFSAMIPFNDNHPMFIDRKYLIDYKDVDSRCEAPGRAISIGKTHNSVNGMIIPVEGSKIALIEDASSSVRYFDIFGILIDSFNDTQINAAAINLMQVAKRVSKENKLSGFCFQPSDSVDKWVCAINNDTNDQQNDVATILLENGRAKIDPQVLSGSDFERTYIEAQASALSKGCGMWSKSGS